MKNVLRLLCITAVVIPILPFAARADDALDWRTIEVPKEIYVCESPELLKALSLNAEQIEELNSLLDQWKAKFLAAKQEYDSRPKEKQRGGYGQHRDRDLKNTISDLLDDWQHRLFHQMLALWAQSPVQSPNAFQFELGLSSDQHRQLCELETRWVLYALKQASSDYQHPRHTKPSDLSSGELRAYRYEITQLAWQFLPQRNGEWSRILSPAQTTRWKERELEWAFQLYQFDLLLADFSVYRKGSGQLSTGTWLDHSVPYFTPPFEALNWTEEQITEVQKLLPEVTTWKDLPKDRDERIRRLQKQQKRSLDCMKKIEQVMTAQQREAWWQGFGEPSPAWNRQLLEMLANSLLNRPADRAQTLPDKDQP